MKKKISYFILFFVLTMLFIPSVSASCSCKSKNTGGKITFLFSNEKDSCVYADFTEEQQKAIKNNCVDSSTTSLPVIWKAGFKAPNGLKVETGKDASLKSDGKIVSKNDDDKGKIYKSCFCKDKSEGREVKFSFHNEKDSCAYADFTKEQQQVIRNNCTVYPSSGQPIIWEEGKKRPGLEVENDKPYILNSDSTVTVDKDGETSNNGNGGNINIGDVGDKIECSDIAELIDELAKIYNILKICLTAGLVVLSMLDFTKAVMSSDNDALKKAQKHLITRIIILVIIFILPVLIDWVIGIANIDGLDSSCIENL